MKDLVKINYEEIRTKEELLKLIKRLSEEDTTTWENNDIQNFLLAMSSWLEDADGFYKNFGLSTSAEHPSWQLFADALQAAKIYE